MTVTVYLRRDEALDEREFIASAKGNRAQICHASVERPRPLTPVALYIAHWTTGPGHFAEIVPDGQEIPVLVHEAGRGRARVEIRSADESIAAEIAAATAVMQVSWAWDASSQLEIVVNANRFAVAPAFTDDRWLASVTRL